MTTRNDSLFDLDLLGVPPRDTGRAAAHQCIAWVAPKVCTQRTEVGDFVWHAAHGHWHFEDFARYELRRLDEGLPDPTPAGFVAGGDKITFCLADTESPSDQPGPRPPWFTAFCPGVIQGISAGWGDTYTRHLPGQQIVLTGVEPGAYALVVTIDPDGRLFETDETNNSSWTTVVIPDLS